MAIMLLLLLLLLIPFLAGQLSIRCSWSSGSNSCRYQHCYINARLCSPCDY
jgi:hypothetical protein